MARVFLLIFLRFLRMRSYLFTPLSQGIHSKVGRYATFTLEGNTPPVIHQCLMLTDTYKIYPTLFIQPGIIDSESGHYLSWDDIAKLQLRGVEVGATGFLNENLTTYSKSQQHDILTNAKTAFEIHLNHKLSLFAYPKGAYDMDIIHNLKELDINAALTLSPGINIDKVDRLQLKRIEVKVYSPLSWPKLFYCLINIKRDLNKKAAELEKKKSMRPELFY